MSLSNHSDSLWKAPTIRTPDFRVLTAEEAEQIRGRDVGVGTCLLVGYSCWARGGFGLGVCLGAGASTKNTGFSRPRPPPPPPPAGAGSGGSGTGSGSGSGGGSSEGS